MADDTIAPHELISRLRDVLDELDRKHTSPQCAEARSLLERLDDGIKLEQERAQALESQLSARAPVAGELGWIRGGDGAAYGDREILVLAITDARKDPIVTFARWDERAVWLDDETDGQNDRIEWYPGQVAWRLSIAALLESLPPPPTEPAREPPREPEGVMRVIANWKDDHG